MSKEPMISVITPSLNSAPYVRECVQSLLVQDYDNFEHIVVDGASKDGTIEILKQFPHLRWISEPDNGEAEALNKGLQMARGDIVAWLNADDYYSEGTLQGVAREIDPQQGRHIAYGKTDIINDDGSFAGSRTPVVPVTLATLLRWFSHLHIYQPSVFFSRPLVENIGLFREDLTYSIDYDYWLRICAAGYRFHYVDRVFACARLMRPTGKTSALRSVKEREWLQASLRYVSLLPLRERIRFWKDYYLQYWMPRAATLIVERVGSPAFMKRALLEVKACASRIRSGS